MSSAEPRRLEISRWARRRHFEFFKGFEQPFFNVCTDLDVGALVARTRGEGRSFFLAVLYLSLRAANEVPELKVRIRGDEVVEHPVVHGGSTVMREDETFGFGYFDYDPRFDAFERTGRAVLEAARRSRTLDDQPERDDLIYYSVLPWIAFTSFAHARRCPAKGSIPRIVLGKRHERRAGEWRLAISVEVHHALVDGLHVARFLDGFQGLLHEPELLWAAPPV
ncbi:MAG: chloramphenicol acetyltransferase [Acidobacteriota bacterium]|nr:chloramphenicol acetyltransferase [Acidobacteriota bacterium]MDH3522814.1 chloramphenicol acetyltransferase [Acidobacteriota bacterium]